MKCLQNASEGKAMRNVVSGCSSIAVAILPARREARPGEIAMETEISYSFRRESNFCQAGVVAPPDSPDLGNSIKSVCKV